MYEGNLDIITTTEAMTDYGAVGKIAMKGVMPYLLLLSPDENVFDYINVTLV